MISGPTDLLLSPTEAREGVGETVGVVAGELEKLEMGGRSSRGGSVGPWEVSIGVKEGSCPLAICFSICSKRARRVLGLPGIGTGVMFVSEFDRIGGVIKEGGGGSSTLGASSGTGASSSAGEKTGGAAKEVIGGGACFSSCVCFSFLRRNVNRFFLSSFALVFGSGKAAGDSLERNVVLSLLGIGGGKLGRRFRSKVS